MQDELLGTEAGIYSTFYRSYDPATGRFTGVDPLADTTPDWTPYQFALGNPIAANDPTGALSEFSSWGELIDAFFNGSADEGSYSSGGGGGSDGGITKNSDVMQRNGIWGSFSQTNRYDNSSERIIGNNVNLGNFSVIATFNALPKAFQLGLNFNSGFREGDPAFGETSLSASGGVGLLSLEGTGVDLALKHSYGVESLRSFAERRTLGISSIIGKSLGLVGAAATLIESANDDNGLTYGDAAKVVLGLAFTFCPPLAVAGIVFAVADIGVQLASGKSISDRLGTGIDAAIEGQGFNSNIKESVVSAFPH
ncbi:RHS repeat-associated core domain-containing protein [Hymenobacter psoromatis]|uniref:RHS repeat-associated core domain-containing protein n=1 Tax=Hymenobacter psoromatis TaxID=1484116 RepID=UPI001CBC740B|nr:RHS repeat-associated core domain-containing protein [Hymenobacter psoromatis]